MNQDHSYFRNLLSKLEKSEKSHRDALSLCWTFIKTMEEQKITKYEVNQLYLKIVEKLGYQL